MGGDVSKDFKIIESIDLSGIKTITKGKKVICWSLVKASPINDFTVLEDEEFSVFDFGENFSQFNNAVKFLKSVRHPNIISILCDPSKKNPEGRWSFATHLVEPLVRVLPGLDFHEIMAGLHDIMKALSFLHGSAGICHNSVGLHSIFVTLDGTWKLGCFEFAEKVLMAGGEKMMTTTTMGKFQMDEKDFMNLLGNLMERLEDVEDDDLQSLADLQKEIEKTSSSSPHVGSHLSECLSSPVFQKFKFLQIRTFLVELLVKNAKEKATFFQSLISDLTQLPEELVAKRLSALLLQRFVLLDKTAREFFLPSFLTPMDDGHIVPVPGITPILSKASFVHHVCPTLLKVFTVHETSIRLALLENFSGYFRSFSRQQLKGVVLNQLLLSARDQNDLLVELSLRALADLVSVLGGDLVIRSSRVQRFYNGQIKETPVNSGFDPTTQQEGAVTMARKPEERLDGILKTEVRSTDGEKNINPRKVLANTVDLSDLNFKNHRTNFGKNIKGTSGKMEINLEEHDEEIHPITSPETWGDDDSVLTSTTRLENDEDMLRCKKLATFSKSHPSAGSSSSSSRIMKPVAVIEPKTIYQISKSTKLDDAEVRSHEGRMISNTVWSDSNKSTIPFLQVDTTHKILKEPAHIPLINTSDTKLTSNTTAIPVATNTLLDISKGSGGTLSKPLNLKPIRNSDVIKDGAKPTQKHEDPKLDDSLEWDDKWEDLDDPSISSQPDNCPVKSIHPTSKKILSTGPSHQNTESFEKQSTPSKSISRPLDEPKVPSHKPKMSDVPLGFGYDIKQVNIKVRRGAEVNEDDEWKLVEDLLPNLEPQKKFNEHSWKSSSMHKDLKAIPTEDISTSGWEDEDLNLDEDEKNRRD